MNQKNWNGKIWEGIYRSFDEVKSEDDIFSEKIWIKKYTELLENNLAVYENKSIEINNLSSFNTYILPLVNAMIEDKQKIKILDFGGGLGTEFLKTMSLLENSYKILFTIVEKKLICEIGEKYFRNYNGIKFVDKIPSKEQTFDIINAGSSFHYVDKWLEILEQLNKCNPKYLIFSDLPAGEIETFVTCQNYYGKKNPVRFWNINEFVQKVEKVGFKLIFRSKYDNGYLKYLNEFNQPFKLDYFSQLLFKSCNKLNY